MDPLASASRLYVSFPYLFYFFIGSILLPPSLACGLILLYIFFGDRCLNKKPPAGDGKEKQDLEGRLVVCGYARLMKEACLIFFLMCLFCLLAVAVAVAVTVAIAVAIERVFEFQSVYAKLVGME